jgi:chloramphenicol-sensitive protein RarD
MKQLSPQGRGAVSTFAAYAIWGFFPFYLHLLSALDSVHVLALRIIVSCLSVSLLLLVRGNTRWLLCFRDKQVCLRVIASGLVVSANWGLYIWAINSGHTLEASIGYFINPLVSILLGMIFFRERMLPLQWGAFGLAAIGVALITVFSGKFPFLSLSLALTFGVYGLIKKSLRISALEGLAAESLAALPVAVVLLLLPGTPLGYLAGLPAYIYVLIVLGGAVTAFPLYLFAKGTQTLPLSAIGFIQFITPTAQFCIGFFAFHEAVPPRNLIAFVFIWAGALLYPLSFLRRNAGT